MIERLLLQQFQAHEKLDLQLGPLTVFVGNNGAGKSTVLRALRWVLVSRPSGKSVLRWGTKWCRVQAKVEGRRVGKERRRNSNTYYLGTDPYEAPGQKVPDPIAAVLQVDEQLNFQHQFDGPFLLNLTGGQAATELNRIADLGLVDQVLTVVAQEVRSAAAGTQRAHELLAKAEQELFEMRDVPKLFPPLRSLRLGMSLLDSMRMRIGTLHDILREEDALQERLRPYYNIDQAKFDRLEKLVRHKVRLQRRATELRDQLSKIRQGMRFQGAVFPELPEKALQHLLAVDVRVNKAQALVRQCREHESALQDVRAKIDEVHEVLAQYTVCPTCGGVVTA